MGEAPVLRNESVDAVSASRALSGTGESKLMKAFRITLGTAKAIIGLFLICTGAAIGAVEGATLGEIAIGGAMVIGGFSLLNSGVRDYDRAEGKIN